MESNQEAVQPLTEPQTTVSNPPDPETALWEILRLLRQMEALAVRAVEDVCSDAERAELQRQLEHLRRQLNQTADAI